MAADAWKLYDKFKYNLGHLPIDLDSANYKMALFTSTSNCNTITNEKFGDLTNEVSAANGYTGGGVTFTPTWTNSSGTETWSSSGTAVWSASGGSIVCRYAVIYSTDTIGGVVQPLVCYSLLDNTPADVTTTSGNNLSVIINASGVFTLSGGS